eukprot:jgi/Botrbrau1/7507/Bobra.0095s0043.1
MADAEDVDLLKDDSADLAELEPEPMAEVEAVTSAPEPEKEERPPKKKVGRGKGPESGSNKAKRIPIPVPPHAKGATKGPSKPATKLASSTGPKSVAVPTASSKSARYFIMKSVSGANVEYSIANGVWATQKHNEEKLQDAFRSGASVYLLFSIVQSGHFQGYARMTSGVSSHKGNEPWQGSVAVGGTFQVRWERVADLSFGDLHGLTNPLNDGKPVSLCRDGQEVPADIGDAMVKLMNEKEERPAGRAFARGGGGPPLHLRGSGRSGPFSRPPFRGNMGPPPRPPPPLLGMRPPPMMALNNPMMAPPMGMLGGLHMQPPLLGDPYLGGGLLGDGFGGGSGGGGSRMGPPPSGMGGPPPGMGRLSGMDMGLGGFGGPGSFGLGDPGNFMNAPAGLGSRGRMGPGPESQRSRLPSPGPRPGPRAPPRGLGRDMILDPLPGNMFSGHGPMDGNMRGGFPSRSSSGGLADYPGMRESYMRASPERERSPYMDLDDRGRNRVYRESRPRRDDRGDRMRSRTPSPSASPPRYRSRRRSRSRSRSRERKDFTNMSYDEYVEMYSKLHPGARSTNPGMPQGMMGMNSTMGMMGGNSMSGQGMMGGSNGMGGLDGGHGGMGRMGGGSGGINPQNLTEEKYLDIWREYSKTNNQPFDPDVVRGWYRQYMGSSR